MDSETVAHMCAQQRHHRYMMFGKKQRYIEVFQCSGEDMNMVLQGASFHSQAAAAAAAAAIATANISKPPLLSPGMLTQAQVAAASHNSQQQQTSLSVAAPSITPLHLSIPGAAATSPSAALIAQQQAQAQFIAQQNLLARQQAVAVQQQQQAAVNEQIYLQQLGYYSSPPPTGPPSAATSALSPNNLQFAQLPQVFYMPRTMMPGMGIPYGLMPQMHPYAQFQHQSTAGLPPTPNLSPISPSYSPQIAQSSKRSYESAFRNETTTANQVNKRQYTGHTTTTAAASNNAANLAAAAAYYSFYPPPM